jgi:hypothetical protein
VASLTLIIGVLAGLLIGAAVAWILLRGAARRLSAELRAAQAADMGRAGELAELRREGETWRSKFESEQVERARFETEARRVAGLESELQQIRGRTEALAIEKSALQIEADRVRRWKPVFARSAMTRLNLKPRKRSSRPSSGNRHWPTPRKLPC